MTFTTHTGSDAEVAPIEGERRRVITDLVQVKTPADKTGDAVTVLEIETPPGGGFPPHRHQYEDETIYVIEGTYALLLGEVQEVLSAGATRFIGRGTLHGYANQGPGPASMLVHLFPGGISERFIREVGDPTDRPIWESALADVIAIAPAFGIEFDTEDR